MSSGTTTPRTASTTPTPPLVDTSPLKIGKHFVKQYYHEISTSPEQIGRFYQPPTSVLTVGTGSDSAVDVTDIAEAATRFHQNDGPVRFEFEHGAIDAQLSVDGGILLVATGQMVSSQTRKSFVHTFFLGCTIAAAATAGSGTSKKSYYVHNDILRFLHQEEQGEATVSTDLTMTTTDPEPPVKEPTDLPAEKVAATPAEPDPVELATEPKIEENDVVPSNVAVTVVAPDEAPGHGVEESKEAVLVDDVGDGGRTEINNVPVTQKPAAAAAAQPPGSWASLVARNPSTAMSPPSTPSRSADKGSSSNGASNNKNGTSIPTPVKSTSETAPESTTAAAAAVSSATAAASTTAPTTTAADSHYNAKLQAAANRQNKRDPDCTLVIKNIDMNATETEVLGMFEPFLQDTTAKVIGCTVQPNRGIAFVDFDSSEPVLKAVAQQTDVGLFTMRERKLEIYQKTVEQRGRGTGSGSGRGGSHGRGSYRGGSGGRDFRGGDDRVDGGAGRSGGRFVRRGDGGRNSGRDGRGGGRATGSAAGSGGR